jgi:hypothetical protein
MEKFHVVVLVSLALDNEEFASLPLFRQLIRLGEGFGGGNRCGDGILGPRVGTQSARNGT